MRASVVSAARNTCRLLNSENGLAPPSNLRFIEYADVHHTTGRSRPVDASKYESKDYYGHNTFSYYKYEIDMLKKRVIEQPIPKVPDAPRDCNKQK